MTTGDRIRAARKAKGYTQKQLGEACGIAEPTIRRYELGKLNPKFETLRKIAKALNLPVSRMMGSDKYHAAWQEERDLLGFDDIWLSTDERIEKLNRLFPKFDVPEDEARMLILQEKEGVIPASLIEDFYSMNDIGREKAVENMKVLANMPEYQRKPPLGVQEASSPLKSETTPENKKSPSEGQ